MSDDPRSSLASAQADLVRALTAQGKPSLEFDPAHFALAARMLVEKRSRAVARAWPKLAESLGTKFAEEFAAYSAKHPIPEPVNARTDGLHFVRFLDFHRRLPDEGRLEWLECRARRHWIAVARLPTQKRLVVCFRLPWTSHMFVLRG